MPEKKLDESQITLPIFFRLIEKVVEEQTEPIQRKWRARHAEKRLSTKGKKIKVKPFNQDPPEERAQSAPPIGESDEVQEISSMAAGSVAIAAVKPKKKKSKQKCK